MAQKRRARGEGGIYRRKDGRWAGQYVVDTTTGSKRRYVYGKTRKEVAEKLRKALAYRDEGLTFDAGSLTLGDYLSRWLNDSVRGTVKAKTFEGHEAMVRVHIAPVLGRVKLNALNRLISKGCTVRSWTRGCPQARCSASTRRCIKHVHRPWGGA